MSTENMNMALVPVLRFPEFEGEWEQKKLGEVVNHKSGKYNPEKEKKYYKCIELEHIEADSGRLLGYVDSTNSGSIKNKFEKGNVLFGKLRPYLRKYLQAPFDGVCSSEIWVLKGNNIANEFLYRLVQTDGFIELANQSSGSKMPRADWNVVANGGGCFPTLPEQKRIASFFTLLDQKLSQLKQKKNLLAQYKKGMLQQIFSQELRFKNDDGNKFPDWEEKKLGEIAEKRIIKNRNNAINHVFTNSASQGIVNQRDFFDKDIANQSNLMNYYIVEKDDFVYNPRISNLAPVGPISRNHLGVGVMSPLYSVFRINKGLKKFYEIYFYTSFWHTYMESIANYGARADRMSFKIDDFYLMPLPFPSVQEQAKIANFLSAIDEKINQTQTQIRKTEQYKKGLLQKMFC